MTAFVERQVYQRKARERAATVERQEWSSTVARTGYAHIPDMVTIVAHA